MRLLWRSRALARARKNKTRMAWFSGFLWCGLIALGMVCLAGFALAVAGALRRARSRSFSALLRLLIVFLLVLRSFVVGSTWFASDIDIKNSVSRSIALNARARVLFARTRLSVSEIDWTLARSLSRALSRCSRTLWFSALCALRGSWTDGSLARCRCL